MSAFDGRALTTLGEIEAACSGHDGYRDHLIALCDDAESPVSSGATWLLKSLLERGGTLTAEETDALCRRLAGLRDWAAQLHVCQSFRYLAIGAPQAEEVARWLSPLLTHERPFLRAWSMDALCSLADQHTAFAKAAKVAHENAGRDAAASVRARARNIKL